MSLLRKFGSARPTDHQRAAARVGNERINALKGRDQEAGPACGPSRRRTSLKRKGVIGGQARRPANREVEIEQGLELLEAVGLACEFCVGLTQGRCSSGHNLDPRIPELEMKPIQEENGAAITSRVGVTAERPVDVVWAPRIEPALSSRKAIEFCGIGVRGEHSR